MSSVCGSDCQLLGTGSVVNGHEVLRCVELGHVDLAGKLLDYGCSLLEHAKSCASFRAASLRIAKSSGSQASSSLSSTSVGGGLVDSRFKSISRMGSWRNKGSIRLNGAVYRPSQVPDGLCYVKILKPNSAESLCHSIGTWPSLAKLAKIKAVHCLPVDELERFKLVQRYDGFYHVAVGGDDGVSLVQALKGYHEGVKHSAGDSLAAAVSSVVSTSVRIPFDARVGGSDVSRLTDRELRLLLDSVVVPEGKKLGRDVQKIQLPVGGFSTSLVQDDKIAFLVAVRVDSSSPVGFLPVPRKISSGKVFDVLKSLTHQDSRLTTWYSVSSLTDSEVVSSVKKNVVKQHGLSVIFKSFSGWNTCSDYSYSEYLDLQKLDHMRA